MNSFIYPFFKILIDYVLYYTNIVEYVKIFARLLCNFISCSSQTEIEVNNYKRKCSTIAIDIFILSKWFLLIYLWVNNINSEISKYLIFYLIYSNLFTYFYYHSWGSKFTQRNDAEALKRNFINYLLAIAYYLACYAYLYQVHYVEMLKVNEELFDISTLDYINAIYLSVSTAFTLTYSGIQPLTQEIRIVFLTQLINTFLFFTIIITNSVPTVYKQGEKQ